MERLPADRGPRCRAPGYDRGMGYFDRKLDRGRAREQRERLDEAALEEGAWESLPIETSPQAPAHRYLRFSIAERHPWSRRREGVFAVTYRLLDEGELDAAIWKELRAELDWFRENLPAPDFDIDAAIFLFRPDAGECTRRIWNVVHLLRECGLPVEMQTISNPGKVIYRDEFQIAVVPWSSSTSL